MQECCPEYVHGHANFHKGHGDKQKPIISVHDDVNEAEHNTDHKFE